MQPGSRPSHAPAASSEAGRGGRAAAGPPLRREWALLLAALLLAAAGDGTASAAGVALTDDLGVRVELARQPQRLVSLTPGNTELLFAIGAGARLVGVTEFCDYPPAARLVPRVAGFNSLSVERIVAVAPDLVIAARGNPREDLESLRRLGLPVFALDPQTVGEVVLAVRRLGALVGAEARAEEVAADLEARIAAVRARVETTTARPRVMWGYWSEPIFTAGARTMIDDVLTLAGGVNVGRLAPGSWPQVGLETVVAWAPEVIITTYHPAAADTASLAAQIARLQRTEGWSSVPAVRDGRVVYVDPDLLSRPGPRLVDALEQVARILHPEMAP